VILYIYIFNLIHLYRYTRFSLTIVLQSFIVIMKSLRIKPIWESFEILERPCAWCHLWIFNWHVYNRPRLLLCTVFWSWVLNCHTFTTGLLNIFRWRAYNVKVAIFLVSSSLHFSERPELINPLFQILAALSTEMRAFSPPNLFLCCDPAYTEWLR
jgi:hypothetical protein